MSDYLDFLKSRGKTLAEINPGSDEFAFGYSDALRAIQLLGNAGVPILGGDILTEKSGELVYAYQDWGKEYIYLNWYCKKIEDESESEYVNRSHLVAEESIEKANTIAKYLGEVFYVVIVI
jgi:hypothetical protein